MLISDLLAESFLAGWWISSFVFLLLMFPDDKFKCSGPKRRPQSLTSSDWQLWPHRDAAVDVAHFALINTTQSKIWLVSKVKISGQPGGGLPIQRHLRVKAAWVHAVASVTSLSLQLPLLETQQEDGLSLWLVFGCSALSCCRCEIREAAAVKQTRKLKCNRCKTNFLPCPLFTLTASIRKMVPRQAAVPWIRRRVLGWCSTLLSPRASAGSPSCTAPTQTTTRRPKPCHATPPSTVRGEHEAITLNSSQTAL